MQAVMIIYNQTGQTTGEYTIGKIAAGLTGDVINVTQQIFGIPDSYGY